MDLKSLITSRRQAYVNVFDGPNGEAVVKDLAKFCRARETTFNADPRVSALLEGRREVFLRIAEHLNLTEEELFEKYR